MLFSYSNDALAQLCGYDFNNLFILYVHEEGKTKEAIGVEIDLVYANYKSAVDLYYVDDHQWLKILDRFVPNGSFQIKRKAVFPRAKDHHICLIPKISDPNILPPIYFVRVIWKGDSQLYHLPYERSLDVCSNHITSSDQNEALQLMRQENGEAFKPFEIILGHEPTSKETVFPLKAVYFVLKLNGVEETCFDWTNNSINSIEVRDYATTNLIQTIRLKDQLSFPSIFLNNSFILLNNATKNRHHLPQLKVKSEENYELRTTPEKRFDYYHFDSASQQYQLDTALSNYFNVTIENENQPASRYMVDVKNGKRISTEYLLKNGKWIVERQTTKSLHPKPQTQDHAKCLTIKRGENHKLPVHLIPSEGDKLKPIIDSFWIYNSCRDTVFIQDLYTQHNNEFALSDSVILPRLTMKVYYSHQIPYLIWPIANIEHQAVLDIKDGGRKNLTVSYNWIDMAKVDSTHLADTAILFEYIADDLLSKEHFITDMNLHPLAQGKALIKTGERVGDWRFHNKTGTQFEYQTLSKSMAFGLIPIDSSTTLSADSVVLQVRENGRWITPIYNHRSLSFWFYVRPNTDSIRFTHNNLIALFTFDYETQRITTVHQLFMMTPENEYYVSRGQKTPITFIDTAFVFRWNDNEFLKIQDYPIDYSKVLAQIQKKLPEAYMGLFNLGTNDVLVSLNSRNKDKLKELQTWMLNNKYVYAVYSSLEYLDQPTYGSTEFTALFSSYIGKDSIQSIAAEFGFEVMNNSYYGNMVQLKHKRKIFDKAMLKDLNALSDHPDVWQVDPNLFFPVEVDELQEPEIEPVLPRDY